MKLSGLLLGAFSATLVTAVPNPDAVTHTPTHVHPTCKGTLLASLRKNTGHRSFCNTFLRQTTTSTISQREVTTTVRTTVARATSTVTVTLKKTTVAYVTSTPSSTVTTTSYSNAPISCATAAGSFTGSVSGVAGSNGDKQLDKRTHAPISTPAPVSGVPSATISSLCSCLQISAQTQTKRTTIGGTTSTVYKTIGPTGGTKTPYTTTVKTTSYTTVTLTRTARAATVTATYVQPVPTVFNGMNWYAYYNTYDFAGYPNIDVTLFNSPDYEDSGMLNNPVSVSPGNSATCSLPGSTKQLNCQQITVVMQAYFYAPTSGTYILTTGGSDVNSVDNYVGLWTGDNAYDNYNNNNADWIAIREDFDGVQRGGSASYQFTEGQLVPMTIIYMNGGLSGDFKFEVITPDGKVNDDTSNFWIPACHDSDLFSP